LLRSRLGDNLSDSETRSEADSEHDRLGNSEARTEAEGLGTSLA